MDIGESLLGEICVLRPVGRLDGATSPEFQARLLQAVSAAPTGIIVDFTEVAYISSAGLRALVAAARQQKDNRVAVAGLQPIVQEIFRIARFQHVVPIFASVGEAARSWGEAAADVGPTVGGSEPPAR